MAVDASPRAEGLRRVLPTQVETADESAAAATGTVCAESEHLELATVLKLSEAVSGEIVLEKLIPALMRTAVEQAGAARGLLILPLGSVPRLAAEAAIDGEIVDVRILDQPVAGTALPESIVHDVVRTRQRVMLDDASAENPFSADEYIRRRHVRSVLCLPLITQNKLAGVLYLENNLAPRVFTPSRVAVLRLLAAQAAIALENARLYHDLQARQTEIRRLVDGNIIGVVVNEADGGIREANDACLKILGCSRDDLLGGRLRWSDLTPPEWRAATERAWADLRETGIAKPFEKEFFRKDGSRVPVLVGGASLDENGAKSVGFVLDLTERKRTEQALRDSEERFRTLVQFSFDVYWETDAEHRFIRQEFAESLADAPVPGSEIGKTGWEVPYLEPDEAAWRSHRETLDTHLPFRDFELARPTPDGGKRYVSVSGLPVFDAAGRFVGYRGVGRHITERKRAEQALRESEEQWRAVFEHNPTMYFMVDAAGSIVSANPFGAEQLGYTVDDLVGRSMLDVVHAADHAAVQRNAKLCFERLGSTMSWEARNVRSDGTIIWVRETGRAVLIKQRPILLIVCEDISERKRVEHLTQQWFESSPNGVAIVGRDYRFRKVNPVYERYWGIPAERIVGMHVAELRGTDDFERVIKPRLDLCFAREARERQYSGWFCPPMERRYAIAIYTPLRPRSEQVEAALVIYNDITEHELAAEALREAQAELAHVNRVDTMGQLTAAIAHEVNQPIAAVVTNAQAALRWLGAKPPELSEIREALGRIVAEGSRAGNVIGRIRALIKKVPARMEPLDVNETIAEVIALTRSEMLRNGVALRTRLGANLPPVRGDRVQLAQVILNFVVNAIEAMTRVDEGSRELVIASDRDALDGVLVTVRDSGPGLPVAGGERLFEPFYTTKPGGMGMGLSICRSIIEAHSGRVWASANVPRGAAFQFMLPGCGETAT